MNKRQAENWRKKKKVEGKRAIEGGRENERETST
jgi:hypothetical protein